VLVTADVLARMRPGSVVVDLAASPLGGNVEGSVPGETVLVGSGVQVIGATNLPSRLATSASQAFGRNTSALIAHLSSDGALAIDLSDEIQQGVVITHAGEIVHAGVRAAVAQSEGAAQ
jgi:NAD(P) transhydrogenase subunit alpha